MQKLLIFAESGSEIEIVEDSEVTNAEVDRCYSFLQ